MSIRTPPTGSRPECERLRSRLQMTHCHRYAAVLAVLAIILLGLSPALPSALGDADPASDFLLAAPVFYPYQPSTSAPIRSALESTLGELKRAGLSLKVAIIDSSNDLGGVSNLWRMPQPYADFLGKEISFNQKQPLLVVMPSGFGVSSLTGADALRGLRIDATHQADGLARSAIAAVVRLGRVNGKPIAEPTIHSSSSSGKGAPALIVFGAPVLLVALAALFALTRRTHSDLEADQEADEAPESGSSASGQ
jgi:hypothetical protein